MAGPVGENREDAVEEALRQFVDARWRGEEPDVDEFVRQYPGLEDRIRENIRDAQRIDSLFDSLAQADEGDSEGQGAGENLVGRRIASFDLVEMIGRGGMGIVYRAHDTKLDRSVAVKSMPAELRTSPTAQARFEREARLLASLNHSNIAVIHDIIEEDKSGYLILEYVPGETLAERIAREPLKLEEALSIGRQIAEAVSAAHDKGIIHRDLKPGNIKIMPDGRVKVLDFGLAKAPVSEDGKSEITVTQPGRIMGTPAYMSPEQARGKPAEKRSDIWSFGCIMYQMLAGRLPFEGETSTDTLVRIIERQPDWKRLPPETPANIRDLLHKCLEKDPKHRLGQIADAALEISEALNTHQINSPSKIATIAMIFGAVLIGFILFGVALKFLPNKEIPDSTKEIRLVVLPFENLGPTEDEYFADGITDAITARLAGIHGLSVISRQSAIQYRESEKSPQEIGQELNVDYILEGTVQRERPSDPNSKVRIIPQLINASEDTHVWTEIYDDNMGDIFHLQSDLAEHVAEALDLTLLEPERRSMSSKPTENMEAYEYYLQGHSYYSEYFSEHDTRIAIRMFERAVELDPGFALAYAQLCRTHGHMYNHFDHSQERIAMAKQAVDKALELDPDLPEVHYALGTYYARIGDGEHALEQFAIVRKSQPNHTGAIKMTGYTLRWLGRFEQAVNNFERVLELNPRDTLLLNHVAYTLKCMRKYAEAERYCDRAISLAPDEPMSYGNKAWLYMSWKGDTDTARGILTDALHNFESTENPFVNSFADLDVFDRDYQGALEWLSSKSEDIDNQLLFSRLALRYAQIYRYMDKKELAKKYYDEARSILEEGIQQYPEDARFHSSLGIAYAGLGRKEDAITEGNLAVELVSNFAVVYALRIKELAHIYVMVGRHDEAIEKLEHLLSIPAPYSIHLLQLDPLWDPLRNHPRFKKLVRTEE